MWHPLDFSVSRASLARLSMRASYHDCLRSSDLGTCRQDDGLDSEAFDSEEQTKPLIEVSPQR